MMALVSFGRGVRSVELPFATFLVSGFLATRAKAAMCSPRDLVLDHLPPFDPDDEEEVREAFAEACEQATDGETARVSLDREDLRYVRNRLLHDLPTGPKGPQPLMAA
jgi:hypothetical protein